MCIYLLQSLFHLISVAFDGCLVENPFFLESFFDFYDTLPIWKLLFALFKSLLLLPSLFYKLLSFLYLNPLHADISQDVILILFPLSHG